MAARRKTVSAGLSLLCLFRSVRSRAVCAVLLTGVLHAQNTSSGTISGQVTDAQGASIAGAQVLLTDKATRTDKTFSSNDAGRYNIFNLPPGIYDVAVTKPGFASTRFPEQRVEVGLVLTLNVSLQLGNTSTTIEVSASSGAELQTTNATIGRTISGAQLENLPNLGRDANALFTLQPGVAPGGNVAGTVSDQNQFQLDGGNNSSDMDGNSAVYTLASGTITGTSGGTPSGVIPTPIETIEEFKVATAGQTADFNGSAGGQVQMATKRGTSVFHGSVYEYLLSSYFGANTWKNNHTKSGDLAYTPLPKTHQNRYGASIGGPVGPAFLGGKTFFFFNYEARRFPQTTTTERQVPSALLRQGIIQSPNSAGVWTAYNLNTMPVAGVAPTLCNNVSCDPRSLGLNPTVSRLWQTMPLPNDPQFGDNYNTQGFLFRVSIPQNSDNYTGRIDHDFGEKWHLMTSYRYYDFSQNTTSQTDIGGLLGPTNGQGIATAPRVQKPSYWVAGLTATISPTITNDFHYSFVRNYWEWGTAGAPPQFPELGGAVEIGGETAGTNALIPYNVNSQSVRQRFWDGQDHQFRDDLSWVKGNHLFQFGGSYQRNFNYHQRDDNGAGIFNNTVYQVGGATGGINFLSKYIPSGIVASQVANWNNYYTEVLGIVSQPQVLYTRSGTNLALQPLGTNLSDKVVIPYYNTYFTDTWRFRKSLTITYGMGYQVEMPPSEEQGRQVMLVNESGAQVGAEAYLNTKKAAALQGQVFNPNLGFATIKNVAGSPKYPYDPFYAGLSPRIAVAWNPSYSDGVLGKIFGGNKTVIRGGYNRIFGRLNGVAQVLNPLLGAAYAQPVSCIGASRTGECLGSSGVDANTAFRIGADGNIAPLPGVSPTLEQPYYPGQKNNAAAADSTVLDQHFRPDRSDVFNFTIQRQISKHVSFEVGYIGRVIKNEFQLINLDAVPTMMTLNGQTFANAFANIYNGLQRGTAIAPQPFFEAVMDGPTSGYCRGATSCTAAVVAKQRSQIVGTQVYTLWSQLSKGAGWTLGRTLPDSAPAQTSSVYETTSLGHGNYNAAFVSFGFRDFHGLTAQSNLTFSRSLGTVGYTQSTSSTTVLDPFNLDAMYGPQPFDIPWVYNLSIVYSPKVFAGKKALHAILGGWSFAPLFTSQSGAPLQVAISGGGTNNCQSFGESNCSSVSTTENAVLRSPYTAGNSLHGDVTSTTSVASSGNAAKGGSGLNIFADPNAVYSQFGRLILGVDNNANGAGILRNFPTWNLDMQVSKEFRIPLREGMGLTFNAQFANLLNHFQAGTPAVNIDSPNTFGVVTTQANTPRQMEFGLRLHF